MAANSNSHNSANLKKVELKYYAPEKDDTLLNIMSRFAKVEDIKIHTCSRQLWSIETNISTPTMISFFELLQGLPSYQFSCAVYHGGHLLHCYCKARETSSTYIEQIHTLEISSGAYGHLAAIYDHKRAINSVEIVQKYTKHHFITI